MISILIYICLATIAGSGYHSYPAKIYSIQATFHVKLFAVLFIGSCPVKYIIFCNSFAPEVEPGYRQFILQLKKVSRLQKK